MQVNLTGTDKRIHLAEVQQALRTLKKKMKREGLFDDMRRSEYFRNSKEMKKFKAANNRKRFRENPKRVND